VTYLYVLSCLNLGTALAHDNHAWACRLAIIKLNTEVFRVRVSAVSCGSTCFSMCHKCYSLSDMTIADIYMWSKERASTLPEYLMPVLVLILATTASFGLGVKAGQDMGMGQGGQTQSASKGVHISSSTPEQAPSGQKATAGDYGVYVASRNGAKYYLPSCSGAGRIKEENKVWFQTETEAVNAGYTPASSCPGL